MQCVSRITGAYFVYATCESEVLYSTSENPLLISYGSQEEG